MELRHTLPPVPWRLKHRPVERGYPVPWFVAKVGDHYDFRVVDASKMRPAILDKLCWICGKPLGGYLAFPIGPMCAITRTTSEPPSHTECAEWAVQACPFLTQRQHTRRMNDLPEGYQAAAGLSIDRQPGVACLWIARSYQPFRADGGSGILFTVGDPTDVRWYREGRPATRDEVLESIAGGLPTLQAHAEADGPNAVRDLAAMQMRAMALLPAA